MNQDEIERIIGNDEGDDDWGEAMSRWQLGHETTKSVLARSVSCPSPMTLMCVPHASQRTFCE